MLEWHVVPAGGSLGGITYHTVLNLPPGQLTKVPSKRGRALSSRPANPPMRNAFSTALLERLVPDIPPARASLVSASNDHTTRIWACGRLGDAASVFATSGAKPAAAGPDGDQDDDDTSLVVPSFGGSAAAAGAGAAWWGSSQHYGRRAGRSEFRHGRCVWLGLGVVRTARQCYRLWLARVHVAGSKVMIGLIGGVGERG